MPSWVRRLCFAVLSSLWALFATSAVAQAPGTLISATPVSDAPSGAQAWRISYASTSDTGQPITLTGMVIAPREAIPARPRTVLAWAHGTWGVASNCVPENDAAYFNATPGLSEAIRRGHVVVAADYPGLGTSMPHPYLVGRSAAHAVLDAVRAARGIPGAAAGSRFAVWGESQGGHAALWTGQLARSYAPDLTLVGVAAAAPPTDLVQNLTAGGDPSVRAFLTAFTAYSWSQHFGAPLSTLGNRSTQGVITRLAQNNCVRRGARPTLGAALGVLVLRRDLRNVNIGRIQPWAGIARRNSPAAQDYGVPFLIAQNPADQIVGPAVTRDFARRLCRDRANVAWISINGAGHETSASDSAVPTLDWIDARFAGEAPRNDCRMIRSGS